MKEIYLVKTGYSMHATTAYKWNVRSELDSTFERTDLNFSDAARLRLLKTRFSLIHGLSCSDLRSKKNIVSGIILTQSEKQQLLFKLIIVWWLVCSTCALEISNLYYKNEKHQNIVTKTSRRQVKVIQLTKMWNIKAKKAGTINMEARGSLLGMNTFLRVCEYVSSSQKWGGERNACLKKTRETSTNRWISGYRNVTSGSFLRPVPRKLSSHFPLDKKSTPSASFTHSRN